MAMLVSGSVRLLGEDVDIFFSKEFPNHGDLPNVCHFLRPLKAGPSWLHIGACPSAGWILARPPWVFNGRKWIGTVDEKNLAI